MTTPAETFDWNGWTPTDVATLLFIVEGDRILLIEKKRGLGAGKVNAPGGRLEPGETPIDAAVRELEEEVGVRTLGVREMGQVSFHFLDGYDLHCHVFRGDTCIGIPSETDEATPFWVALADIPYERMRADDAIWLPHLIAEKPFRGRFVFDRDAMLTSEVTLLDQ